MVTKNHFKGELIMKPKIQIKPENKGKFTAKAKQAGMGVQEFANKSLAKGSKASPETKKQANFAKNAAKWNKGK